MFRAPRKPVRGFTARVNKVTPGIPQARANDTAWRGLRERDRIERRDYSHLRQMKSRLHSLNTAFYFFIYVQFI